MISGHGIPGEFSFASIYGSNMVLQRGPRIPIWGYANEKDIGTNVTIQWGTYINSTVITKSGMYT